MILKRLQRNRLEFNNGWRQMVHLIAEVHQEKGYVKVVLTETSAMGKYIRERVCKDVHEAYFIAEEHTA
jgi:hypothetical protein